MLKISIFLFFLLFAGAVFLQASAKQLTEREKIILEINREVGDSMVIELLRKNNTAIRRSIKDDKALSALKYSSFSTAISTLIEYRWFIADTGLSKKWLKGVRDLLAYMSKTQSYLESAKFNGRMNTPKYKKSIEYFDVAYKRFVKLIKKPVKVSGKVSRRAKLKKAIWQKGMRKKYKINKNENEVF